MRTIVAVCSAAVVLLAAVCAAQGTPPGPPAYPPPDWDCPDFSYQEDAQQWLLPGDPHLLDDDGDGIACELLPRRPPSAGVTLTVTRTGSGSGAVTSSPPGISCGSACQASFPTGSEVTLTATPDTGSTFNGWGGACASAGTAPTCKVILSAQLNATATFASSGTAPDNTWLADHSWWTVKHVDGRPQARWAIPVVGWDVDEIEIARQLGPISEAGHFASRDVVIRDAISPSATGEWVSDVELEPATYSVRLFGHAAGCSECWFYSEIKRLRITRSSVEQSLPEIRRAKWRLISRGTRSAPLTYSIRINVCDDRGRGIRLHVGETAGHFVNSTHSVTVNGRSISGCKPFVVRTTVPTRFWHGGQYAFTSYVFLYPAGSDTWTDTARVRMRSGTRAGWSQNGLLS